VSDKIWFEEFSLLLIIIVGEFLFIKKGNFETWHISLLQQYPTVVHLLHNSLPHRKLLSMSADLLNRYNIKRSIWYSTSLNNFWK
jgi:hypothetical protein